MCSRAGLSSVAAEPGAPTSEPIYDMLQLQWEGFGVQLRRGAQHCSGGPGEAGPGAQGKAAARPAYPSPSLLVPYQDHRTVLFCVSS